MCDINQDNSEVRSTVSLMSLSDDGIMTPNSSDFAKPSLTEYVPSVPGPGKTYKIHLKDTDKVIAMTQGEVLLQSPAKAQPEGGWNWVCVEKGNWLGFRNQVSGTFLGHDGKLGFHAKSTHHKAHEIFCVRHHRDGGYLLLVKYSRGGEMRQLGSAPDGKTLIRKEKDGAQWMFEEICEASVPQAEMLPKRSLLKTSARIVLELLAFMNTIAVLDCVLPEWALPLAFLILFVYFRA